MPHVEMLADFPLVLRPPNQSSDKPEQYRTDMQASQHLKPGDTTALRDDAATLGHGCWDVGVEVKWRGGCNANNCRS
jgi:hypothetical protein